MAEAAEKDDFVIVFVCGPLSESPEGLAKTLVHRKLAASINIIPKIVTVKASRKHIAKTKSEFLYVIKTRASKITELTENMMMCYDNMGKIDVTATLIVKANEPYLQWMAQRLQPSDDNEDLVFHWDP